MPSRIGMPSVGRPRKDGLGFSVSRPGALSQTTMPQSTPLQFSISIWADLSSTSQTPLGSAAAAEAHAEIKLHTTRIGKRILAPFRMPVVLDSPYYSVLQCNKRARAFGPGVPAWID